MNLLVSIICTDLDFNYYKFLHQNIMDSFLYTPEILIVTRNTDLKTIEFWKHSHIELVDHYDIIDRHNVDAISNKRNLAIKYAKDHSYDSLLFIDSDILINSTILRELKELHKTKDIVIVPYEHCLTGEKSVGTLEGSDFIMKDADLVTNEVILGGGAGCTLINMSAFDVSFERKNAFGMYGEDIGFFLNAFSMGKKVGKTSNTALHIYEKNKNRKLITKEMINEHSC